MRKYDLYGYQVEIDEKATAKWYEASDGWRCECGYCRNFLRAVEMNKLPPHIAEILNGLGILPQKATYVCKLYTDTEGLLYQFGYRIAGIIVETPTQEKVEEGCCCHEKHSHGAPDFPKPHFDLEFFAVLPWVLDETPNG